MSAYKESARGRTRGSTWSSRLKSVPKCSNCGSTSTISTWKSRPGEKSEEIICHACFVAEQKKKTRDKSGTPPVGKKEKTSPTSSEGSTSRKEPSQATKDVDARRTSRRRPVGSAVFALLKQSVLKSRTAIPSPRTQAFKPTSRRPTKAPTRRATVTTTESIWEDGIKYQVGDIVGVQDKEDEKIYYAQLRGLLTDQYCNRFATVTWLLPTKAAPEDGTFDPLTFVYGPNDETLYPMNCVEFHCHAPTLNLRRTWNPAEEALRSRVKEKEIEFKNITVPIA